MNRIILLILLATTPCLAITPRDKVYNVEKSSPEIKIGPVKDSAMLASSKSPMVNYWHVSLERSSLTYRLLTVSGSSPEFSPSSVGVEIGRKWEDRVFNQRGNFEFDLEWQRFDRKKNIGNTLFVQNLDSYQASFFQNVNLGRPLLNHKLLVTAGLGLAPVFLTSEQSVYNNSLASLGYIALMKVDFYYALKKYTNLDFALKTGWGRVGGINYSTSTLSLGVDFE